MFWQRDGKDVAVEVQRRTGEQEAFFELYGKILLPFLQTFSNNSGFELLSRGGASDFSCIELLGEDDQQVELEMEMLMDMAASSHHHTRTEGIKALVEQSNSLLSSLSTNPSVLSKLVSLLPSLLSDEDVLLQRYACLLVSRLPVQHRAQVEQKLRELQQQEPTKVVQRDTKRIIDAMVQ